MGERAIRPLVDVPAAGFRDPDVGLHRHDHVALVEQRVEVRRPVDPDAGYLRFGQFRCRVGRPPQTDGGCRRETFEKVRRFTIRPP